MHSGAAIRSRLQCMNIPKSAYLSPACHSGWRGFLHVPLTYSLSPDFRATNVPHPGDAVTSPRRLRSCTARAAVDDATPNASASGTAPGSRVPGGYVPSAIRCSRITAICGHAGRVGSSSMAIKLGRLTGGVKQRTGTGAGAARRFPRAGRNHARRAASSLAPPHLPGEEIALVRPYLIAWERASTAEREAILRRNRRMDAAEVAA